MFLSKNVELLPTSPDLRVKFNCYEVVIDNCVCVDLQVDPWRCSYWEIEKQGVCEKIQRKDPCRPRKVPGLEGKGALEVFRSLRRT